MKHRALIAFLFILVLPLLLTGFVVPAKKNAAAVKPGPSRFIQAHLRESYGNLPLAFEPNQGQTDPQVKFLSHGRGYTLFITSQEAVLELKKPKPFPRTVKGSRPKGFHFPLPDNSSPTVLRLKLEGAQADTKFEGLDALPGVSNYLIGRNRSRWISGIPLYSQVASHGLAPGLDMVYYGNQEKLEYDFVVQPGADPRAVRFSVEGAQSVQVNGQGDVELQTNQGSVFLRAPSLYQESDGQKNSVEGRYELEEGNKIGFEVKDYDRSKPLVIDPILDYSTYLGGSGNDSSNGIAVDDSGNAYLTGFTQSADFPTQNPLQGFGGQQNAYVTEINAAGTALVFSTYLGGSGYDSGNAVAVDPSGNIYLTGYTGSADFPTFNPLQANLNGNFNAFVVELGPGGSAPVFSTYLGGSIQDGGFGIALDKNGYIYITGSADSPDFPVLNAIQPVNGNPQQGYGNAFVSKINPGGASLAYSTFLGGSGFDSGTGIAVDGNGGAYVSGYTGSLNFPTVNPFVSALGGQQNGFITEVNPAGTAWTFSTYWGGSGTDQCTAIALDPSGDIYAVGGTNSPNFPTQNAVQPALLNTITNAFVSEFAPGGSSIIYSTYLGGTGNTLYGYGDSANGLAVDASGDAYVAGYTGSADFPTVNPIQSSLLTTYFSVFLTVVAPQGGSYLFSTYLGGTYAEVGTGAALDSTGDVYLTGYTYSSDFPTVNPIQANLGGATDAFALEISQAFLTSTPTVTATPTVTFSPTVTATPTASNTPTVTSTFTFTPTPTSSPTATVTTTPSNSPTATSTPPFTATPTPTATPQFSIVTISAPYPDPAAVPLSIQVQAPNGSSAQWDVFTTSFRKIFSASAAIPGNAATLAWDLRDESNVPVANGLYYIRVRVNGLISSTQILKVLVIR